MTSSHQGGFVLGGSDRDEIRLLVHERGYAIAVPGHPRLVTATGEAPRYDAIVVLDDAPIELGVRMDEIETSIAPDALVSSLVVAYATARARAPQAAQPVALTGNQLAPGAAAGVQAHYSLRGDDPTAMEFLAITAIDAPPGVLALHLTARWRTGEITRFDWYGLRAALLAHQSWRTDAPPSTQIWPTNGTFAKPAVKLALTEAAMAAARSKAEDVGAMAPDEVDRLADALLDFAAADHAPSVPWHPLLTQMTAQRIARVVPSRVAEVLLRDLGDVTSMHDFRGWCWQCYWAVGNRAELRARRS